MRPSRIVEGEDAPLAGTGFQSLHERESQPMLRLAALMVGSRQEAEDLVQEAFLGLSRDGTMSTIPAPTCGPA